MSQEPPTERLTMHEDAPQAADDYSVVPEKDEQGNDCFAVIHKTHGGGLGCIRHAGDLREAREIICELRKANA